MFQTCTQSFKFLNLNSNPLLLGLPHAKKPKLLSESRNPAEKFRRSRTTVADYLQEGLLAVAAAAA